MEPTLTFLVHPERLAIARLGPAEELPAWVRGSFVTVSRTATELSIVCAAEAVPPGVRQETGRVALGIEGQVPMTTVGLLAGLCHHLAAVQVPVFVISTYDTDYLLVAEERFDTAVRALVAAGHRVRGVAPR
jgi:hypothetical protein